MIANIIGFIFSSPSFSPISLKRKILHADESSPSPSVSTAILTGYENSKKAGIAKVLNLVTSTFPTKSGKWKEISLLNLANSALLLPTTYFAIANESTHII